MTKDRRDERKPGRGAGESKSEAERLSVTGEEIRLPPFHPNEDLITFIERSRWAEPKKRRGGWSRFLERLRFW